MNGEGRITDDMIAEALKETPEPPKPPPYRPNRADRRRRSGKNKRGAWKR